MNKKQLLKFVDESNRIEGILRSPTEVELLATERFLSRESFSAADIVDYVDAVANAPIRDKPGMDVRVGNHLPPPGGLGIVDRLIYHVEVVTMDPPNPWLNHVEYETLHPFMDGNGRSGRLLWAWEMIHKKPLDKYWLEIGFLHAFYYQTLDASPHREKL